MVCIIAFGPNAASWPMTFSAVKFFDTGRSRARNVGSNAESSFRIALSTLRKASTTAGEWSMVELVRTLTFTAG